MFRFLQILYFILSIIHLFIFFYAEPTLIAIFITERVILHKFIYLFIIIILIIYNFLKTLYVLKMRCLEQVMSKSANCKATTSHY